MEGEVVADDDEEVADDDEEVEVVSSDEPA